MKQTHWILFICLTGIFIFLFQDALSHIIWYHEQHHLFLFTQPYFYSFLSVQAGLSEYIANFIIQFFYIPCLGIFLFSFLLGLIYLLIALITRHITGRYDWLVVALIPPLYLFIQYESVDYPISHTTSIVLCLLLFYLISLIKRKYSLFLLIPWFLLTGWFLGWIYPVVALSCVTISCLSAILSNRFLSGKKTKCFILVAVLFIYGSTTFYYFVQNYSMRERLLIEAEKGVKDKKWTRVLEIANRYRGKHPLMAYFSNLAFYHTGELPQKFLLHAPDYGVSTLYLPWTGDPRYSLFGHFLYEDLGHINEAHRWTFESMVVFGENADILINLIRYNIVNQRPEVARKFINVLKSSLFYKNRALAYEKIINSGEIKELKKLTLLSEQPERFVHVTNIAPELQYILEHDPHNKMAFEYLMCYFLIRGDLNHFVEYIPYIANFDYASLPRFFEEALWLHQYQDGNPVMNDYTVSNEIKKDFDLYGKLVVQKNMNQLRQQFGNSYWYYFDYLSSYKK